MDQNQHGQPGRRIVSAQPNTVMSLTTNPHIQTVGSSSVPSSYPREHHYALQCMHRYQQKQDQLQEKVKRFWAQQLKEIEESTDLRTQHSVPLSRVKKIMKTDPDVKLVSAEAPVVFSKACELFIMELTLKAWANAEDNNRRTIKKTDIASAIARTDVFDFLEDIAPLPRDHRNTIMHPYAPTPTQNVPYYMPPLQHVANPPPPYVAATTLHQIPYALQNYSLIPSSIVPPNQRNPSPSSDD